MKLNSCQASNNYMISYLLCQTLESSQNLISNIYNKIQIMIYTNIKELGEALLAHPLTEHQIKGKRLGKELQILRQYSNHQLTFKKYQLSAMGLSFYIQTKYQHRIFDFQIFIDSEYPFNPPQIFYQYQTSQYGYAQDLLENLLRGGVWGPSILLNNLFDELKYLAKLLFQENENLLARYHINEIYEEEVLQRYRIQMFKVDFFTWRYMIKSTNKTVIGLTKETLLKFVNQGNKLKLQAAIKIKDIKEANASISSGKFKLDIITSEQVGQNKLYFGGQQADLESILYFMNPIQSLQRKMSKQKQNYNSEEFEKAVKEYSDLIEYYSLRDPEKTKMYVNRIQNIIKNNYSVQMKEEKKMQNITENIKK